MRNFIIGVLVVLIVIVDTCSRQESVIKGANLAWKQEAFQSMLKVQSKYTLSEGQTHNTFGKDVPPALTVPSGAIIEAPMEASTNKQNTLLEGPIISTQFDRETLPSLMGPIFLENAQPGDILKVTFRKIEMQERGSYAVLPGFGFSNEAFDTPYLKAYNISSNSTSIRFSDKIKVSAKPYPGLLGVAPAGNERHSTLPSMEHRSLMSDPHIVEGTTVYFPIQVEGALFSLGDIQTSNNMVEVGETTKGVPVRVVYQVEVLKNGRPITEPEYETDSYYSVTAVGTTIDKATKKAVGFMVDYLMAEHGLVRKDAYALCSLAGDLKIPAIKELKKISVALHISKEVLGVK